MNNWDNYNRFFPQQSYNPQQYHGAQSYYQSPQQQYYANSNQTRFQYHPFTGPIQNQRPEKYYQSPGPSQSFHENKSNERKLTPTELIQKYPEIFAISKRTENGTLFNCELCKVKNLPKNSFLDHAAGKRHQNEVKKAGERHQNEVKKAGERHQNEVKLMEKDKNCAAKNIEFIPFGDKVYIHCPIFKLIIHEVKEPLVALTYIVEILNEKVSETSYVCVLCNVQCDPRTIVTHLVSQSHRFSYFKRHFSQIAATLSKNRRFIDDAIFREHVLKSIAKVLEDTFGRSSNFVYDGSDYDSKKSSIFDSVNHGKHITKDDIPNAEVVLLRGINLDLMNPRTQEEIEKDFRNQLRSKLDDMRKKFKQACKDPVKHPLYRAEWQIYFKRRTNEFRRHDQDPKKHNYQTDWFQYFFSRLRYIQRVDEKRVVSEMKKKFGIVDRVNLLNFGFQYDCGEDEFDDDEYLEQRKKHKEFVTKCEAWDKKPAPTEPLSLMSLLIHLLSMETQLDELVPKLHELIIKSREAEGKRAYSSDDLLLDRETCDFLNNAQTKLLEMLGPHLTSIMVESVNKGIREIFILLEKAKKLTGENICW